MSRSDTRLDAERLEALPPLPRDEEGPIFAEPWQAQAFALAVKLSEQGHFSLRFFEHLQAEQGVGLYILRCIRQCREAVGNHFVQ